MEPTSASSRRRRWRSGALLAGLGLAVSAFGGVALPRLASTGMPASLAQAEAIAPAPVVRHEGRFCPKRTRPSLQLASPRDR